MKTDTIENLLSHVASECSAVDVDAAYEGLVEIGNSYYRSDDVEEALESFIEGLESDIEDLQELDDDNEDGPAHSVEIADLKGQVKTARSYTF